MCNPIVNLGLTVHPTFLSLDLITVTVKEDSASQKPVIHQECNVLFVGIFSNNVNFSPVFVIAVVQ